MYTTVYEVGSDEMFSHWIKALLIGLVFTSIWLINRFSRKWKVIRFNGPNTIPERIFNFILPISAALLFILSFYLFFSHQRLHNNALKSLKSGNVNIIQGEIQDYNRSEFRNVLHETFSIGSSNFEFQENDYSYYGYRPEKGKSLIKDGDYVKLSWIDKGGKMVVLKVELKNQ